MGFGRSFQYVNQPKVLKDGDYVVKLGLAYETEVAGYKVLRFPFTVEGEKEECRPNYFDLFDVDDDTDQEKVKMFRTRASKIIDCFGLSGTFSNESYADWVGKKGQVRIEKSENGFVNISQFYKSSNDEKGHF